MTENERALFGHFRQHDIEVSTTEHPPVFTVDEAREHCSHLPGGHCKNLFLKDKKGGFWLIVCLDSQPIKVGAVQKMVQAPRMSFGKPEALMEILGVNPGSVTPFALINDKDNVVVPIFDRKMFEFELLNFHPLRNSATTTLKSTDLIKFAKSLGYDPHILDLDPPES